jgi:hypothetical protein
LVAVIAPTARTRVRNLTAALGEHRWAAAQDGPGETARRAVLSVAALSSQ